MGAPPGSTYSREPEGLSAIYAVLDGEGLAQRWERMPRRLPAAVDRLVVWDPQQLEEKTWTELENWVSSGHALVIAGGGSLTLPGQIRPTGQESLARSAAAAPVALGVEAVAVGGDVFETQEQTALIHLTRPDGTAVLISWPHGRGRIYWSADAAWLSNQLIGQEDNLTLALGLLAPAKGKQVAFDEYSHGYAAADRWWQLLRGSLQAFVLQLIIFLAVLFWAFGVRFGAPLAEPETPPRAAVEYVFSMSQLYRRARARSVALQSLYRSLTRDLGGLLGGLQGMDHAEIARRTAERTGLQAANVKAVLDRTAPGAKPEPNDRELIDLARETEAIQRSVHNAGYRDRSRA
jgi:hypothetical protein